MSSHKNPPPTGRTSNPEPPPRRSLRLQNNTTNGQNQRENDNNGDLESSTSQTQPPVYCATQAHGQQGQLDKHATPGSVSQDLLQYPQPAFAPPTFVPPQTTPWTTPANQNQQRLTFQDIRHAYSSSAPPFTAIPEQRRIDLLNTDVQNLKATVKTMKKSLDSVEKTVQELPDVLQRMLNQFAPTTLASSASSQGSHSRPPSQLSSNDGISFGTTSSIGDAIGGLPPGFTQDLLDQRAHNHTQHQTSKPPPLAQRSNITANPSYSAHNPSIPVTEPDYTQIPRHQPPRQHHNQPPVGPSNNPPPGTRHQATPPPVRQSASAPPISHQQTTPTINGLQPPGLPPTTDPTLKTLLTTLTQTLQPSTTTQTLKLPKFKSNTDGTTFYPWKHEVFDACIIHPIMKDFVTTNVNLGTHFVSTMPDINRRILHTAITKSITDDIKVEINLTQNSPRDGIRTLQLLEKKYGHIVKTSQERIRLPTALMETTKKDQESIMKISSAL